MATLEKWGVVPSKEKSDKTADNADEYAVGETQLSSSTGQSVLSESGGVIRPTEIGSSGKPYTDEYITDYIEGHGYCIFDVRYWESADRTDVLKRLQEGWKEGTNDGHGDMLIGILLRRWPVERIADLLMSVRDKHIEEWRGIWWKDAMDGWREGNDKRMESCYGDYAKCCQFLGKPPKSIELLAKRNGT